MKGVYLPSVSDWGVWLGTSLEVVGDNHSPAPIYVRQWDIVVLDRHLVLLVLAALGICVGYMCVWWCLTGTWSCVGYIFVCAVLVFSACCTVAICEVGCLART